MTFCSIAKSDSERERRRKLLAPIPPLESFFPWRLSCFTPPRLKSLQLIVSSFKLDDGTHGEDNLSEDLTGPIFQELRDPETLKKAFLDPELRTVCWPNGADSAPEFLRSLVSEKRRG